MTIERDRQVAKVFGTIIAEKRKVLGMSQELLAEYVGITQESLSRMEKGLIAPRFERLQRFADALQCSISDLFQTQCTVNDRAAVIEKLIATLPDSKQSEIIEIVARIAALAT